jgi:hypothetical protein
MVDRGFFPPAITLCGIAAIPLPCIPVPGMERTGGYFQKIIVSRDCHYYCAGSLQFQFLTFDTSGSRCFAGGRLGAKMRRSSRARLRIRPSSH